jgi:hypothetical protein
MQTVDKIGLILPTLDVTQLRQLNSMVVGHINNANGVRQLQAMNKLRVGSTVEFMSSKQHRIVRMRIDRLNTKTVSGTELNRVDNRPMMATWKVAPSMLTVVA